MIDKLLFALLGFIPGFFVGILFIAGMMILGKDDEL